MYRLCPALASFTTLPIVEDKNPPVESKSSSCKKDTKSQARELQ